MLNEFIKQKQFLNEKLHSRSKICRLESACKGQNMSFRRNDTNSDTIDLFINDIPGQAKYCGTSNTTFSVTTAKSAGILNGKQVFRPYAASDPFEFLIVEVGGRKDHIDKYHGSFCIIPKSALIIKEILPSPTTCGRVCTGVCAPDYHKDHWTKQYWNRFDLLQNHLK
jgi:hypothetical protein